MSEPTKDPVVSKGTALDGGSEDETVVAVENGVVVNASGYRDQLKRQYGLLGLAGIAVTVDNAWVALGSSISVSIRTPFSLPIRYRQDCALNQPSLTSVVGSQWRSTGDNFWLNRCLILLYIYWTWFGRGTKERFVGISRLN